LMPRRRAGGGGVTTSGATEASSKAKICGDGTGMVQLQCERARRWRFV
jgi:hypothetical protein